jgi:hypothetical protein
MLTFRYAAEARSRIIAAAPSGAEVDDLIAELELLANGYLCGKTTPPARLEQIAKLCDALASELNADDVMHIDLGLNGEVCMLNINDRTVERSRLPTGWFAKTLSPANATPGEIIDQGPGVIIDQLRWMASSARNRIAIQKRENASKQERNLFVMSVLICWLERGGKRGGPTSAMATFVLAACKPVLGADCPTSRSLVTMAYKKDGLLSK